MSETSVKQDMLRAIERLPDDATLEDVAHLVRMHELYAQARKARAEGRVYTHEQVGEMFGLLRED